MIASSPFIEGWALYFWMLWASNGEGLSGWRIAALEVA